MVTSEEVAWAAGLFEGEGTLHLTRKGGARRYPQAALGMVDRDVVERFAAIVGLGQVKFVDRTRQRIKHQRPRQDMWYWTLENASGVQRLIELLYPFFGERRRAKADEVLAGAREVGARGRSKYATHCIHGHEYTEENTYWQKARRYKGGVRRKCRQCRACTLERQRQERIKARAARSP